MSTLGPEANGEGEASSLSCPGLLTLAVPFAYPVPQPGMHLVFPLGRVRLLWDGKASRPPAWERRASLGTCQLSRSAPAAFRTVLR